MAARRRGSDNAAMTTPKTLADWLAYIEGQHTKTIDMGLARCREVAERMGLPLSAQRLAQRVVTVGGTNGKGSTVAFIESIARAAGWRVGTYTSPHLLRYNERVRIEGRDVEDEDLIAAFEAVEAARVGQPSSGASRHLLPQAGEGKEKHVLPLAGEGKEKHVLPLAGEGKEQHVLSLAGEGKEQHVLSLAGEGKERSGLPQAGESVSRLLDEQDGVCSRANIDSVALTYFEFGTLAALWLFAQRDLDLLVLEVGLGGRLDAVNLVDADVAVITTVDLDHQDWLGDTIEAIGFEKAGIARAWKPLVLGDDDPPSSVLGHAYAIGASALRIGCDFFFDAPSASKPGALSMWHWRELGFELQLPMPALAAPVQLRNAAVAIAALRALHGSEDWDDAVYARGIANARIAARLQRFERDGIAIWVDVGHNPQAARALADALRAEVIAGRTHAVFAALGDKDIVGVVDALASEIDCWWLAGLTDAGPRGVDVETFAASLRGSAAAAGERYADVSNALKAARASAMVGDRILVFGSFFTAAAVLNALNVP
jgi:dihydrofolate synthase / folylpolyglutamate synthase